MFTNSIMVEPFEVQDAGKIGILKVLAYFDIFHYPLTKKEIKRFLDRTIDDHKLDKLLDHLLSSRRIFSDSNFYSLQDNPLLTHRRKEGNLRAAKLFPTALKIGRFLYHFPFVRAIGISGSLSKNFADEKADIDFFIITKANRLWIARTIMHVFKKLTFITGHQHFFCMNYYIDEEALLIGDKNIFTAIEIATLVPVCGKVTLDDFFASNSWHQHFFSARDHKQLANDNAFRNPFKKLAEFIFNNQTGDRLDNWLCQITTRRWQQKSLEGQLNKNGNMVKLITGKHFARSNPGGFQEKVLALYEQKLMELNLVSSDYRL